MEDLRAIRQGVCSKEERERCGNEFGENLEWACGKCEKAERIEALELNAYTAKLFRLRLLRAAGYPFGANDLTPEEWEDLGKVELCLQIPTI